MIDLRLGQQRPVRMRRIDDRHMIVMPTTQAQLLSLDTVEQQLQQARQARQAQQAQVARLDVFIADLEQQVAAFKALPIERDAEDPDVPQPEGVRGLRGPGGQDGADGNPGVRGLARVTPVGFGRVPEGATPVPPPELIAADR
jgi:outer membrane receptor protein involved in Fe transport